MNHPHFFHASDLTPLPAGVTGLFDRYRPDTSLFAAPGRACLASGEALVVPTVAQSALVGEVSRVLAGAICRGAPSLVIGALPFDEQTPARLYVPARIAWGEGGCMAPFELERPGIRMDEARSVPDEAAYCAAVEAALEHIAAGELLKVVLSRRLSFHARVDVPALLRHLASRNTHGYTFGITLGDETHARDALVGASPELLLARRGRRVVSNPLAGSLPRSADPCEDRQRAARLLESVKDRHEHAVVVDAVGQTLAPYCAELDVPAAPSLLQTPTMWHLSTRIEGVLRSDDFSALELAMALHPTPAVCGHPADVARRFINRAEGFDRGLFTGLVGWCDGRGDGDWAVTIRCARIGSERAEVYAGAGIVAGSEPMAELAETAAKMRTMLDAMGVELDSESLQ